MVIYKPIILQIVSLTILLFYILSASIKRYDFIKKAGLAFLLLLILSLVFLSRDYLSVTIDLPHYMHYYVKIKSIGDVFDSVIAWKGDYFFFSMMPIAHLFNLDPEEYISFQTAISVIVLFIAYNRFYSDSKSLVFLALFFVINSSSFYFTNGNVLRQGFASSLLLLALTTKTTRNYFSYKVITFFTHRGSMFSFLSPLVPSKKKWKLLILISALIIGYFGLHFQLLMNLPMPEFLKRKIGFYSVFERASTNSLIKLVLLLFFNFLFIKFFKVDAKLKYKRAYNLYFIFSVAALLLYKLDGAFSRTILFSDIFLPILMISVITGIEGKKNKLIALFTCIFISLIYSIYVFNHSSVLFNIGETFEVL